MAWGNEKSGMGSHLLIPVDFSDRSMSAVSAGFYFARVLGATPVLMHVYPTVWYNGMTPADLGDIYDASDDEITTAIEERSLMKVAEQQFGAFKKRVNKLRQDGSIADVNYTSLLVEGIAEDAILEYCRDHPPRLVVMSTRGLSKKAEELIGSVTAEVLDNCRVPVFTVPEKFSADTNTRLHRVLMFCTLDQYDVMGLERLMDTFNTPDIDIWLLPMEHREGRVRERLTELKVRLSQAWPHVEFHISDLEKKTIGPWIDEYISRHAIQMVIAPNRRTSIFSRLFRPTVAHQCLFSIEIPMLALPVGK